MNQYVGNQFKQIYIYRIPAVYSNTVIGRSDIIVGMCKCKLI